MTLRAPNLIDKIAGFVPGYRSFTQKESRRDADKRLRDHVASLLDGSKRHVDEVVLELNGVEIDAVRYLTAVAGLEAAGRLETAKRAYTTATAAWPDQALAWLGLGNVAYRRNRLRAARNAYRRAHALAPGDPVVTNNLAQVLGELGCAREAGRLLDTLPPGAEISPAVKQELAKTRLLVQERSSRPDLASCRRR